MRIALIGYGKMGKQIERLAKGAGHTIAHRIGSAHKDEIDQLTDTDVAIEFTTPEAAVSNYLRLFERRIPVVSGTTGWYGDFDLVCNAANKAGVSFFYATNFSIGVQIALATGTYFAKLMDAHRHYHGILEEWHHTAKKDAPSGTAITFAERIIDQHGAYSHWKLEDSPEQDALPIKAYRENDIPGTHRLTFSSDIDQISLEHKAFNRDGFAGGALEAAAWMLKQPTGIYTMKDLLNL